MNRTRTGLIASAIGIVILTGCNSLPGLKQMEPDRVLLSYRPEAAPAMPSNLTLAGAKEFALNNNPDVTAASARVDQAYAQVNQARAGYAPSLSVYTAYDHTEWQSSPGFPFTMPSTKSYRSGLEMSWLVYDGMRREFTELAARYGRALSEEAEQDMHRLLCRGVAQAFYATLLQQELMTIAKANSTFNKKLLDDAILKREAGAESKTEELNFRIAYNSARSQYLQAERDFRISQVALAQLLGLDSVELPEGLILERGDIPFRNPPKVEEAFAAAGQRPDLRLMANSLMVAKSHAKALKGNMQPTVAVNGQYGYARGTNMEYNSDDRTGNVGVGLSWDLDAGGAKWQAYKEAKAAIVEAEADLRSKSASVHTEIRQEIENVRTAKADLLLSNETAKLSRELRDMEHSQWELGAISITRLNEVQTNLVRAEGNYAVGQIQLMLSHEVLDAALNKNVPTTGSKSVGGE